MNKTQWASVEEARNFILSQIAPIDGDVRVPLRDALGRILSRDVVVPFNVPGHDNSAMDGFACRFADLVAAESSSLKLVGESFAGRPSEVGVGVGECVKVMTGARIPAGADIVIPQEETETAGDGMIIMAPAVRRAGAHLRLAGEDLRQGEVALAAGAYCQAAEVGLLSSLGVVDVAVRRRLRAAFFSTGDELKSLGDVLLPGEIYDSNRHTLDALLRGLGVEALDLGVVPDRREALAAAMDEAAQNADVIITSGGASVGEADFIRAVLAERGEVLFWKVAMRPGRPLAYGKIGGADFFGLPGNPVSVMVCFYIFVREALWKRAGRVGLSPLPMIAAVAETPLKKSPGRMEFQRGQLSPDGKGWRVRVTGDQGSGILSSMTRANCFIVLPEDAGAIAAGEMVEVLPFGGLT